jgi:hypothetical protein
LTKLRSTLDIIEVCMSNILIDDREYAVNPQHNLLARMGAVATGNSSSRIGIDPSRSP